MPIKRQLQPAHRTTVLRRRLSMHMAAIAFFSTATMAPATTIVRKSVSQMTNIATTVIHGRCTEVKSNWTPDRKQILTSITLKVSQTLKGHEGDTVTFLQMGGRVGNAAMVIPGAPKFAVGEELIVFLIRFPAKSKADGDSPLWLLGLGQGVWDVIRGVNAAPARARLRLDRHGTIEKAGPPAPREMSLASLSLRISKTVEANRQKAKRNQENGG